MTSWANSGARDLHLDLRTAITPRTRGAREALVYALRDAIRSGRLLPGTMLPPSRTLANDLGVARNTVGEAYSDLVAAGWLASRQGAGTWVVNTPTTAVQARPRGTPGIPTHNLMPGSGDVSQFPRNAWLTSTRRALTNAPAEALRMGDASGRIELREALTEYLGRVRGVRTTPDQIVICAGTRHGVEVLTRALGGPIAVEAYGLFLFREAIAANGARSVPIDVDDDGAVISELDTTAATAVLLTPAHHFPHGVPLQSGRRSDVLDWAHRTGGYVWEDDYDGEFRYDRQPVGSVQGLDPDRVVYLGSASKSLSPVLRLGWMVLPADLVDPVIAAMGGQQFYVNALSQLTMADFINSGAYDKHIRRMRMIYRRRRDHLVAALKPLGIGIRGLSAGLHLQLALPPGTEAEVMRRAGEAGIGLSGLHVLRHPDAGPDVPEADGIVVSFGTPAEHGFPAAVDALCRVLAGLTR
ncbi:PLP-dependent aminotransferase family protein [Mycolicibacterium neoaurum]|uniref:MocR-like pyridoxine biosynthesis transcription factor PdxR n=1 Tax=Mycolicibacterium neoaurum TaxID=1795 RepID=UPI00248B18F5|nr:PLP-dependent aminotransferase family protein [Mycolicibacterium neoaurum]WBP92853.1 PLP-dependent aminotransferase family protein [Mycolicibacterium neoaurum]WBS07821.1 PLP-dependent aminotransferase family protein [Mycolicibacterium neoaurum]